MRIMSTHPKLRLIACDTTDTMMLTDLLKDVQPTATSWTPRVTEPRFHAVLATQQEQAIGYLALNSLLRDGWTPITQDPQQASNRLELTGAGVQ